VNSEQFTVTGEAADVVCGSFNFFIWQSKG